MSSRTGVAATPRLLEWTDSPPVRLSHSLCMTPFLCLSFTCSPLSFLQIHITEHALVTKQRGGGRGTGRKTRDSAWPQPAFNLRGGRHTEGHRRRHGLIRIIGEV